MATKKPGAVRREVRVRKSLRKVAGGRPRLTVFRKDGAKWLVIAHANFAVLEN